MAMQALGVSLILQMASICIISAGFDFIGWGLQVLTLVRFFVQFHDMAHFSFFASINLNKIAGNILGVVLHIPY
jgi:fatty acid desaturase